MNSIRSNHPAWRAALIDLDGTMVDTLGDFAVALNAMLGELALPPIGRDFIADTVGKGSEHLIRCTLAEVGAAGDRYDDAWASYQRHYRRVNGEHAEVFPGVVEGLLRLQRADVPMACLTNKPTAFAQALLEKKQLAGFFRHVFGGDAFAQKKPHPLPLLESCKALGVPPSDVLMVGDSANDAQAARAAGCPVVLVTYGYNHGEPVRQVDADGFIDRLDQLVIDA
ncbi:phosphoglycolate phosphatase [Rhizobacter sp. OV335]|uniref:phosphoglycolate phosphatase n=1 Tax=Rhizobacter sp. OV335 TaxID=1500264 RepID=UPI000935C7C7|nr:phosphoglycolate phosphatase [Rhizobacter sp. OV335]